MAQLKTVKSRILTKENDTYTTASAFAQYRWIPATEFQDLPFYIYANNTAIMGFQKNSLDIFVIENKKVTNFYRRQFEANWVRAIIPRV